MSDVVIALRVPVLLMLVALASQASACDSGFARHHRARPSPIRDAYRGAYLLATAVRLYQNDRPGTCPSLDDLLRAGIILRQRHARDPWQRPYLIECGLDVGATVRVMSLGADGLRGTDDDIDNLRDPSTAGAGGA